MIFSINILSVSVMTGLSGPDQVFFQLDKPGSMHPYTEPFTLKGECANGTGLEYIKKSWPEITRVKYLNLSAKTPAWVDLSLD